MYRDPAAAGIAFAQSDPRERRLSEQAEGDEPGWPLSSSRCYSMTGADETFAGCREHRWYAVMA